MKEVYRKISNTEMTMRHELWSKAVFKTSTIYQAQPFHIISNEIITPISDQLYEEEESDTGRKRGKV